jgi:transposase
VSRLDVALDPKAASARRVEVITGGGGSRRRWSHDEKARAIEASLAPGAVVSEVARGHGVTPQQLFGWRREARQKAAEASEGPSFVRAIIETPAASPSLAGPVKTEAMSARPHNIELDIEGASVWIWRGADPTMVTSIIGALKARE